MTLKEKIVCEALRQFSAKGYLPTSTSAIIEKVGCSKGGLYNHFKSKEQLFFESLNYAKILWRERNLKGLEEIERPLDKLRQLLVNYQQHYLTDTKNLPGGCVFVNLAVELGDQHPQFCEQINTGFTQFKAMIKRLLDQEKERGTMASKTNTGEAAEILFTGLLGACVVYSADKSTVNLNTTLSALSQYLTLLEKQ